MSKPQFTADEQYVMRAVQSKTASALSNSYMWGYLTGGVLLAGFAAYHESMPMLLSAFVVVCGFRIYEERNNARWAPVWQSILEKYEVALAGESGELDRSDHS